MSAAVRKAVSGALCGIVAAVILLFLASVVMPGFFSRFEAATYDWRVRYESGTKPEKPVEDVVVIDVDARSVSKLGKFYQWPRTYWVRALDYLRTGQAKLVGFDIIFDRDLRQVDDDRRFIEAIRRNGRVVNAVYLANSDSEHFQYPMNSEPAGFRAEKFSLKIPAETDEMLPQFDRFEPAYGQLLNAGAGVGFVNLRPDEDGVIRRISLFNKFNGHNYPSLSLALALKALHVDSIGFEPSPRAFTFYQNHRRLKTFPVDRQGKLLIKFSGPFQTFRYLSFYDVLMGFIPADYFRDRIVIIGSSLPGLYDLRSTPVQAAFPGVEINANLIEQFLTGNALYQWPFWKKLGALVLLAIFSGILFVFLRPGKGIALLLIIIFGVVLTEFFVFSAARLYLPMISPIATALLTFTLAYIYRYRSEEKGRKEIQKMFSQYVPGDVVKSLVKNPDLLKLGGEEKTCTLLFSDLAGFTSISEKLPVETLVALLNSYLSEMTEIIFSHGGTLDKYQGDAIMAIYGAPLEIEQHALKACRTALQMQKRLAELRKVHRDQKIPALTQRIGINSGKVIVGNMGSRLRFDYTAIGDAVNLAARLESANKFYDTGILLGENTFEMVKGRVTARYLDLLRVKGKEQPVKVYELLGADGELMKADKPEWVHAYRKGILHYQQREWDAALDCFRQALRLNPQDGPSRIYQLRCQEFRQNPPPDNWDGVFRLRSK